MNVTRESVYAALWTLVSSHPTIASTVKTKGRLLKPLANLKPEQTPALFLVQKGETAVHDRLGAPIKWTLKVEFVLFIDAIEDLNSLPATQANNIMDAIEASLQPDNPEYRQHLNNLVKSVSIEGQVQTDEGLLGPKAIWAVPVSILVP